MTQAELVTSISETLTQLDNTLMDPVLQNQPRWQQIYDMRTHLDDQQRELLAATIKADDATFQTLTGKIQQATTQLQQVIHNMKKIDAIISNIAQISADLDAILKAAG